MCCNMFTYVHVFMLWCVPIYLYAHMLALCVWHVHVCGVFGCVYMCVRVCGMVCACAVMGLYVCGVCVFKVCWGGVHVCVHMPGLVACEPGSVSPGEGDGVVVPVWVAMVGSPPNSGTPAGLVVEGECAGVGDIGTLHGGDGQHGGGCHFHPDHQQHREG